MDKLIREMLEQMIWADGRMWDAIRSCPGAEDDARLRKLLVHLGHVQRVFPQMWQGQSIDVPEESSFADLAAIETWYGENHRVIRDFLAGGSDLDRVIVVPWSKRIEERFGRVENATLGETMIQVGMHSMYHRGQVNARVRELGGEPALVDFIAWVWGGREMTNDE